MEHCPRSAAAPSAVRKPRQSSADYRWTQPKVIAFLEALARCGKVAEAARAVGMSAWSAYRLRRRMASPRFDAAFEGARKTGTRARAAASRARAVATRSIWEGPGIAELVAREQGGTRAGEGGDSGAQGGIPAAQGGASPPQGAAPPAQGAGVSPQGGASPRKVTKNSPGPCNTRSMSAPDRRSADALPFPMSYVKTAQKLGDRGGLCYDDSASGRKLAFAGNSVRPSSLRPLVDPARPRVVAHAGDRRALMPMNDLLAQHQLAKLNAQNAESEEDRARFSDLESIYAAKIEAWRAALELPSTGWPTAHSSGEEAAA